MFSKKIAITVDIKHDATVYVVAFPPKLFNEYNATYHLEAYSVFSEEWSSTPNHLDIMVGTEGAYVEESMAGKVFNIFYMEPWVVETVEDILDKLNITDEHTRIEIAATALWAAQLVREAKEQNPNIIANMRGLDLVIGRNHGFLVKPLTLVGLYLVHFMDRTTLYKPILHGIKSVEDYVEIFPE